MDKVAMPEGKYLASVKLGPKGQIVVPKEVREMFGIRPGDTLLLLADVNRGLHSRPLKRRIRSSVMSFRTGSNKVPRLKARHFYFILTFCLYGAISKKSITNKKWGA
ncbi:AbrB/MazE/SpoVT family DNA-binding domain-containing protein [Flavonifractor plautii]|nr:AbrB/MazE/SpoVT family DNA-binding domain-containing protein [Flavonifractor plautii]